MAEKRSRYQIMEQYITYCLIADGALFLLYLLFAGLGMVGVKITLAVVAIILSLLILGYLYLTKELFRRRSLWMGLAAAATVLCLLVSLVVNFPSPKYELPDTVTSSNTK